MIPRVSSVSLALLLTSALCVAPSNAAEVVAFWSFPDDYDFASNPTKQDFTANAGVDMAANLQAYVGDPDELDNNGGGGFVDYTSATSGITYDSSRTVKFDDISVSGSSYPDFTIDGVSEFTVDTGEGPEVDNFGEDALLYLTLDASGFSNLQLRFDIEATPGDLPESFDLFYRTTGPSGTWYRSDDFNNIALSFTPVDDENSYADTGMILLPAALNDASSLELIINDFGGNQEMEIDNFEIIGTRVPEPSTLVLAGLLVVGYAARRRC